MFEHNCWLGNFHHVFLLRLSLIHLIEFLLLPEFRLMNVLTDTAYPVGRQDRHFYLRLFLLSRKASNATIIK